MIDVLYYEPYERCKQCYYKVRENTIYKFVISLLWCTAGVATGIFMVKYGVI